MTEPSHDFGGDWTQEKLERVQKYLSAYTTIMDPRRNKFRFAYIDAFAGTGYRTLKYEENPEELLFPELAEPEPQQFLAGSARIALEISPPFDKYVFIELQEKHFRELQKLKDEYPNRAIDLRRGDANVKLQELCSKPWYSQHERRHLRAVVFLDPYGMQVEWTTIEAIAQTKAIDLWILFPLMAVNRVLKKNGELDPNVKEKLDRMFGEGDWYDEFYLKRRQPSLFGDEDQVEKVSFEEIGQYFVRRLKTVFKHVAENPLLLLNSRNNPLFLLCFAAENQTAVKIAQHILK